MIIPSNLRSELVHVLKIMLACLVKLPYKLKKLPIEKKVINVQIKEIAD